MATLTIGALQWRLYSPDTPDLVAPYLVDFTQYGAYDFVPRGAQALLTTGSVASADGVVVDNMLNANDCTVTVGAITEFVPRYQKVTIPLPGISAPDVILTAAGGTTRVTFYTGTYHGTGSNINGYASNKAGAVSTVTDGTIDAYLNSLRWKINYNLTAGFNLDNITDSGFYDVLNPTNAGTALPAGTWFIEHHTYSSSPLYAFQIARNLVAPKAAIFERRLLGGSGWTAWAAPGGASGNGQCRFVYASATKCVLIPYNGNKIIVNGAAFAIPQAGLTLTNAGLGQNVLSYVYLQVAADGVTGTLIASATGHVTGADGTEVMNGDATKAYVGMVYTGNDANPGSFFDQPDKRWVCSWFNPQWKSMLGADVSGNPGSSYVEMNTAGRIYFLTHTGFVEIGVVGTAVPSTYDNVLWYTKIDDTGLGTHIDGPAIGNGYGTPINQWASGPVQEGQHYAGIVGRAGGSSATFAWTMVGRVLS